MTRRTFAALLAAAYPSLQAQRDLSGSAKLKFDLQKLANTGSVLMIGAHPDDERSNVVAYLARGRKVRTAYLALNRGEGGQNLIGSDRGENIGLIRTQELLAARRIDGAEQYFTRAIDFGFSKTAQETLEKWGKEQVLADVVWVIRQYRPDVIINVFSGTPQDGHGNHQLSAMLSKEAFRLAADPQSFPDQLSYVQPWQAKRLLWSPWGPLGEKTKADVTIDTGDYDPLLAVSFNEIAGQSRSMHKSQSMGTPERKGTSKVPLTVVAGDAASSDLLEGVDLTWKRLPQGAAVQELLERADRELRLDNPAAILPALLQARKLVAGINDPIAKRKLTDLDEVIADCAGIWVDASASRELVPAGSAVEIKLNAIVRSKVPAEWSAAISGPTNAAVPGGALAFNTVAETKVNAQAPVDQLISQPYWLRQAHPSGSYKVDQQRLIGQPWNDPVWQAQFKLRVQGDEILLTRPVIHRFVDPVLGELVHPVVVVPPVAVSLPDVPVFFGNNTPKRVKVTLQANQPNANGTLRLRAPEGWRLTPATAPFAIKERGARTVIDFQIAPPAQAGAGDLTAEADLGNGIVCNRGLTIINYSHIPPIATLPPAETGLVRADVRSLAKRVGYVMGSGDEVPEALRQLGLEVTMLDEEALTAGDLSGFDAIVTGVRAFNTRTDLRSNLNRLLAYAEQGGTLVVQYNVLEGFFATRGERGYPLGPYPIELSRNRVTVEEAPVKLLAVDSPLLNAPNKIVTADFDGWVQERGLYFPGKYDPRYQTLWASRDPNEDWQASGNLVAKLGKGAYVYTSYAWFRQLPAGVPGAYRLFANLLSAGKTLK